ncbi:ATP-binding protein [Sphaerisporangium rhizosphaerae]|uniref:ATP-binding protein n=1 Tax=Sphaerisporangium rhizosphaerae TaxID=2269375 RepID=A0ABW2P878_9ACTN
MTIAPGDTWTRAEDRSVVGALRKTAATLAVAAGFTPVRTEQMAIAVGEAVSNLVKHATEGTVLLRAHPESAAAVEFVAIDKGPGFSDFARVLRDGHSTAGTLGIGLGAMSRMASGYDVYSQPGKGTVLTMHFWEDGAAGPPLRASGLTRPIGEETVCGDSYAAVETGAGTTVVLCDGLGHGYLAAEASREAMRVFRQTPDLGPTEILERVHRGLTHTRGGAIAVARVGRDEVSFAGLGNVAGWIVHGDERQGMVSLPGIVGHQSRRLRQFVYPLPAGASVVLHSDGLTSRWNAATMPGLFARSPSVISATLLREAGTRRDDACVVTVKAAT